MAPDPYVRFWQQLDEINRQLGPRTFVAWPPEAYPGSGVAPEYAYERRIVLCRTAYADEVVTRLGGAPRERQTVGGCTLISVDDDVDVIGYARSMNSAWAAEGNAGGPLVTPNHLVSITSHVNICPADEPVPVAADAEPWPPRTGDPTAGAGVSILVIDTGVPADHGVAHPEIGGLVITDPDQSHRTDFTEPVPLPVAPGEVTVIKEYAGHGLFIAGILSCVAPGAEIRPSNALQHAGAMPEAQFGKALTDALDAWPEWPDIISLSAGCPTMDGHPLQGLEDFRQALAEHPRTLLVAAAGNDATPFDAHPGPGDYQFWPAAYAPDDDGVVSVGALARHHDRRACFTNYGSAVTVYARGEDHVNAFLSGEYRYRHGNDPQCHSHVPPLYSPCSCVTSLPFGAHAVFRGWARWSGTSFATPIVAGMVAVHMQRTGERDARRAFADLFKREAQQIVEDAPGAPLHLHAFL